MKIKYWECSICHKNFEECSHEVGKRYGNETCGTIARGIESASLSVVSIPADPRCTITDLLIIKKENEQRTYEWHGFAVNHDSDRFKSIQHALEQKLIPVKAAFYFGKFFSANIVGKATYPT
jgi:hypothetical protein